MIRFYLVLLIVLIALNIYLMGVIDKAAISARQKKLSKWLIWLLPFVWALFLLNSLKKLK